MAMMNHIEHDTVAGTIGGTLLAIIPHLDNSDVARTLLLGGVGAVASFVVTQLCKWLWSRMKNKLFNKGSKGQNSKKHDKI